MRKPVMAALAAGAFLAVGVGSLTVDTAQDHCTESCSQPSGPSNFWEEYPKLLQGTGGSAPAQDWTDLVMPEEYR